MSANTQTSEIVLAISDGRSIAMSCAAHARNPESGDFGKIAQALDFALPKVAEVIDQRDELLAELERVKEFCLREVGNGVVDERVIAKAKEGEA